MNAKLTATPIHHARHVHWPRSSSGAATSSLTRSRLRASGSVQRTGSGGVGSLLITATVTTAPS